MTQTDDERIVRATVAGIAELPGDAVKRLGGDRVFALLSAATTQAVHRKFSTAPDSAQLTEFVRELKTQFAPIADVIDPAGTEAVVAVAFGNDALVATVEPDRISAMLFMLPYAILTSTEATDAEVDAFVAEVIGHADTNATPY